MKKIKKMPVVCTSLGAQQKTEVIAERSLDFIYSPGCYAAKIDHTSGDVGLPFGFCSNEHYFTATLIVTESGTDGQLQNNRMIGQTLILPACDDGRTRIFTRTQKKVNGNHTWSDWRILAQTGMDEEITNTEELVASVTELMSQTEDIKTNLSSETARTHEAEATIENNAILSGSLNASSDTDCVTLTYSNIDGTETSEVEIPAATTESAGVMSAEDKNNIEDVSKKTNNIRVTEESSEIEEIVICNNDESEEYVKINNEGLTAKKIFNSSGEEIEPSGVSVINEDQTTLELCDEEQRPILTIDSNGNINTASFNSLIVAKNKFKGRKMLYIGDSISTGNIWHWKGYIKDCLGLNYVDYDIADSVNVTPAVGGITIRPHNDDDTRPMNAGAAEVGSGAKSIWWRCCNKRLGIYDFDYINLFGGTNDIYDNNLNVGSIDDTPLLDTDVEDLSTLDLSQVSFASAFMGCIEMLQRDFTGKQIFICTLLYNGYARTPDVVKIQMLVAQKYGLIVVPFYYSELNSQNYQWLCDGFHPKQVAARIMEKNFIEFINL